MKKAFLVLLLALCMLTGCSAGSTTGYITEPASVIPLGSPSPEAPEIQLVSLPGAETAAAPSQEIPSAVSAFPSVAVSADTGTPNTESPSITTELSEQLDRIFDDTAGVCGSVLIEKDGRVLLCRGYGMAAAEKGVENSVDTQFLIGSVTKQFTAMAIMQLYESKHLDIYDRLSDYIPDFTRGGEITLVNLLTQTSGITDYLNDEPALIHQIPYEAVREENLIGLVKTMPLKFEPGSKYSYSNTNYLILGYIVEKVTGVCFADYLAMNIFEPLGMKSTGVFDIAHPPENMATGYTRSGEPVRYITDSGDIDPETANAAAGSFGAGCLYSTVGDLLLWDRALTTETLLSKEYMDMIFHPSVQVSGAEIPCAYGFGWVIEEDPDVGTVCRHTGVLSGFRVYNGIFTDQGVTVIALFNVMQFPGRNTLIPAVKQVLKAS